MSNPKGSGFLGFRNEIFIEMNKVTWRQYEVDENETLMSISIKPGFIALSLKIDVYYTV